MPKEQIWEGIVPVFNILNSLNHAIKVRGNLALEQLVEQNGIPESVRHHLALEISKVTTRTTDGMNLSAVKCCSLCHSSFIGKRNEKNSEHAFCSDAHRKKFHTTRDKKR